MKARFCEKLERFYPEVRFRFLHLSLNTVKITGLRVEIINITKLLVSEINLGTAGFMKTVPSV